VHRSSLNTKAELPPQSNALITNFFRIYQNHSNIGIEAPVVNHLSNFKADGDEYEVMENFPSCRK